MEFILCIGFILMYLMINSVAIDDLDLITIDLQVVLVKTASYNYPNEEHILLQSVQHHRNQPY